MTMEMPRSHAARPFCLPKAFIPLQPKQRLRLSRRLMDGTLVFCARQKFIS
jgi:hypothetical protein